MSAPVESSRTRRVKKWATALLPTPTGSKKPGSKGILASEASDTASVSSQQAPLITVPQPITPVVKPKLEPGPPVPEGFTQELVKFRANSPNRDILRGQFPLAWACVNGHLGFVETILNGNPQHQSLSHKAVWSGTDPTQWWRYKPPFLLALERGHVKVARFLVERGARAFYVRDISRIIATCGEDPELMKLVTATTFTTQPEEESTPFETAIRGGDLSSAKVLLEYGAISGYTHANKERMVSECGDDPELMWMVLQQTFPTDEIAPDPAILASRVWILIFAMKKQKPSCVQLLWGHGGCCEYVRRNNAETTIDALYYLYKNLCGLEKAPSATLDYILQSGAAATIRSMWQRSKDNIRWAEVPYDQTPDVVTQAHQVLLTSPTRYEFTLPNTAGSYSLVDLNVLPALINSSHKRNAVGMGRRFL